MTAAAAALGLPRFVWIVTLVVALILGAWALLETVLEPRRRKARQEALDHLEYRHLTGSMTVAWLFDVFREDPTAEGLRRGEGIVLTWVADVADTIRVAIPGKHFTFINDRGGPLPSYRGLRREQLEIVGLLERHVARLGAIIEEAEGDPGWGR